MTSIDIVNYDEGVTRLYKAIEKERWDDANKRCKEKPDEARIWIYRKNPDGKTIRWCVLPIHQACARHCPVDVMNSLIDAYPNGVRKKSFQMASERTAPRSLREIDYNDGNLPIHFACEWGVPIKVIEKLLLTFPESVKIQDRRGLTPMTIAVRAKYEDKNKIAAAIDDVEHKLEMKNLESQVSALAGQLGEYGDVDPAGYAAASSPSPKKTVTANNNSATTTDGGPAVMGDKPPPLNREGKQISVSSVDTGVMEESLHAKIIMLESENAALKETVVELTKKVSFLSASLEAMVFAQGKIVKLASQQEKAMTDLAESIKQDVNGA